MAPDDSHRVSLLLNHTPPQDAAPLLAKLDPHDIGKVTFGAFMHFAGRDYTNYLEVS